MSKTKTYIDVAYKDRELAKRLGARWDPSVKRWYCPADSTLALIYKWRKVPALPKAAAKVTAEPARAEANDARVSRSVRKVRPNPAAMSPAPATLFDGNLELPLAG